MLFVDEFVKLMASVLAIMRGSWIMSPLMLREVMLFMVFFPATLLICYPKSLGDVEELIFSINIFHVTSFCSFILFLYFNFISLYFVRNKSWVL